MIIFGSHVGLRIPNIGYAEVYDGIWGYKGVYECMKVWGGIFWSTWPNGDGFKYALYTHIFSYTVIYFNISNIRNMRADRRLKNGHISRPRASPRVRIWHHASYHVSRGSDTPTGGSNIFILLVLRGLGVSSWSHNHINRGTVFTQKGTVLIQKGALFSRSNQNRHRILWRRLEALDRAQGRRGKAFWNGFVDLFGGRRESTAILFRLTHRFFLDPY